MRTPAALLDVTMTDLERSSKSKVTEISVSQKDVEIKRHIQSTLLLIGFHICYTVPC